MEIKQSYLAMIRALDGGWPAMAGAMGMTQCALENRVYEKKGQGMRVDEALQMQDFSRTTLFAQAIAQRSGGVFVQTPAIECDHRDDVLAQFNKLYAELGTLSAEFNEAVKDDRIDRNERRKLEDIVADVQAALAQLLALALRVYGDVKDAA